MIFCEKCFLDSEIIPIIHECGEIGECQICHSKNVYIYNTDKHDELTNLFEELISIFTPAILLPDTFPKSEIRMIKSELFSNWNIFNRRTESEIYGIVTKVCKERYEYSPELFDSPIGLKELYETDYIEEHSLLTTKTWEGFVESLKSKNRFHTHYINLQLLDKFCSYIRKPYKKGTLFYRGRISTESGYSKDDMGAPPNDRASEGRANAKGISCLYLADSIETTLHEVRAGAFDYVTIGTFELLEDVIVVDLKRINLISPFIFELDCREHAINKEHLNKINNEMGKALRRSDSPLDYVATQYISDFIKSRERDNKAVYAGVEYKSVMNETGYNIAIFDESLFKCTDVEVYAIKNITYNKQKI
ncbi:MAG TPA: RES domain-containing protein [Eubacteriaceae bacterium]|nr:RES domain-containing protein [Eubacteriaceae bacterium]